MEVGKKKRSRLKPSFLVIKITLKRFLEGFLVRLLVILTKKFSRNRFNVILMGKKTNQEMPLLVTKVKMKNKSTYKSRIRKRTLDKTCFLLV